MSMLRWYRLNEAGEPELRPDPPNDADWWNPSYEVGTDENIDGSGVDVSTVFLRLDHSWGNGPPILWETMVFGGDLDGEQDRYTTRAEAEAGHAAMLARVRLTLQPRPLRSGARQMDLED